MSLRSLTAAATHVKCGWSVMDILEADTKPETNYSWSPKFAVHRHHPGRGSCSMAFVVGSHITHVVRSVRWKGRVGALHLRDLSNSDAELNYLMIHGPHTDLITDDLKTAANFLTRRPWGATPIELGDFKY